MVLKALFAGGFVSLPLNVPFALEAVTLVTTMVNAGLTENVGMLELVFHIVVDKSAFFTE